ncbi:hypothetical protein EON83_26585 [bacterium]|nr:MAG: hypothetical protein EON83_26585 [bacterium]
MGKNRLMGKIGVCLLGASLLAGCVSTSSYRIISTEENPSQMRIMVGVAATSTIGNMQVWANHLENQYKPKGKTIKIDFYSEGGVGDKLIGTYQGGSVRRVPQ